MKIAVLGAGTWGMALANLLFLNGNEVVVWSKHPEKLDSLEKTRVHPNLPGMLIPDEISFSKDMGSAVENCGAVVFAVPSVFVRGTARAAKDFITNDMLLIDVAKGIEEGTLLTMSEIIEQELGGLYSGHVTALSGPTHAEEVALLMPTAIVAACSDLGTAEKVQNLFMNSFMRVYTNDDIHGVELCGAVKNVIALAAGISRGLGHGDNAMAAIITRGIEELRRLGVAMGAKEKTFSGLTGIGDLIVTATSMHSRNNRCGILIGQGKSVEEAKKEVGMVVEGLNTLPAALELAKRYDVEMPITQLLGRIVKGEIDVHDGIDALMHRDKKME